MGEWLSGLRCARGAGWAAAAIAAGILLMLLWGGDAGATREEKRMQRFLSGLEGAGEVRVMLYEYEGEGGICRGAAVAAEGAHSIRVQMDLVRAVCAMTGLDPADVEILPMDGG